MIGILKAMGCISSTEEGQGWMSHHPVPLTRPFPYQMVGSHFRSSWEITSGFGKLTCSAHFQIRKIWRSPAPKLTVIGDRPSSQKPLAWEKLKESLFLPHSTDVTVWNRNFNTWTHQWLHFSTADKTYEYTEILPVTTKILNLPKWPTY